MRSERRDFDGRKSWKSVWQLLPGDWGQWWLCRRMRRLLRLAEPKLNYVELSMSFQRFQSQRDSPDVQCVLQNIAKLIICPICPIYCSLVAILNDNSRRKRGVVLCLVDEGHISSFPRFVLTKEASGGKDENLCCRSESSESTLYPLVRDPGWRQLLLEWCLRKPISRNLERCLWWACWRLPLVRHHG